MAKPITIYKTTILYLLSHSSCPLSNLQITDFFLQAEYTDYFQVQEVLAELVDFKLIDAHATHENTLYSITSKGKESLSFLEDKLNFELKEDIRTFYKKNKMTFQTENSVYSDYRKINSHTYRVALNITEDSEELLQVSLLVHSEEQAKKMCDNWRGASDDVYATLLGILQK